MHVYIDMNMVAQERGVSLKTEVVHDQVDPRHEAEWQSSLQIETQPKLHIHSIGMKFCRIYTLMNHNYLWFRIKLLLTNTSVLSGHHPILLQQISNFSNWKNKIKPQT